MNKEQRKILDDHTEFIVKRIKQFRFKPPLDIDECTNYVLYKIVDRIGNYNKKINSVLPFLNRVTTNLVYDYYRKELKNPHDDSIDCKILEKIKPDTNTPEKEYWQERRDYEIACAINELCFKDMTVIKFYYYDNKTEEVIGRMFGVTKQAICQQIKKIEKILKPKIAKRLAELEEIREQL